MHAHRRPYDEAGAENPAAMVGRMRVHLDEIQNGRQCDVRRTIVARGA